MKRLALAALLLCLALPVSAAAKKEPCKPHRVVHRCQPILSQALTNFRLTAGYHWAEADTLNSPFIGGEVRFPLNRSIDLGATLDRDFTDNPRWNARIFVSAQPWK